MRILHLPTNVGNQPWGLSLAERSFGHTSRVLVYTNLNPSYGADYDLHFEKKARIVRLASAVRFFAWAVPRFDIFHFYFATTFFPGMLDLPFLALAKKKIFCTFQGCDIRSSDTCVPAIQHPDQHRHAMVAVQQRRLRTLLRYAKKSYVLNPDLLDASPTSSFFPYASVNYRNWEYSFQPFRQDQPVIVFHAPSDRLVKGTAFLESAITRLQSEGYNVQLDLAFGVSNDEVKRRLKNAHLAVDQLLVGYYGAAAVEMMASGKPTISYLREDWMQRDVRLHNTPILNATSTSIYAVLKNLLDRPQEWQEISQRGRRYVEQVHDPVLLAKTLLHDYATTR